MKILVIEDDKSTSDYIAQGLEQAGHLVTVADNGNDGLFHATDGNFDVIILDRMLPGIDGIEVIGSLRRDVDSAGRIGGSRGRTGLRSR